LHSVLITQSEINHLASPFGLFASQHCHTYALSFSTALTSIHLPDQNGIWQLRFGLASHSVIAIISMSIIHVCSHPVLGYLYKCEAVNVALTFSCSKTLT